MDDIIKQTSQLFQQYPELLDNQIVGIAATEMIEWVKGKLGMNSSKEEYSGIEEDDSSDTKISEFEKQLEFILKDNEDLQKELAEKVNQIQQLMSQQGISIKTNTINSSGNQNISLQDINSKGDINISF